MIRVDVLKMEEFTVSVYNLPFTRVLVYWKDVYEERSRKMRNPGSIYFLFVLIFLMVEMTGCI